MYLKKKEEIINKEKLKLIIIEDRRKYLIGNNEFNELIDEVNELQSITSRANEILAKYQKQKSQLIS